MRTPRRSHCAAVFGTSAVRCSAGRQFGCAPCRTLSRLPRQLSLLSLRAAAGPMGRLILQECSAKGCENYRRSLSEGVELDPSPLLAAAHCRRAQSAPLLACCHMHARACRAAVLAEVAGGSRTKRERAGAGAVQLQGVVAVRQLLRLTVARGRPANELLWRLVSRVAPELVADAESEGEEEEAPRDG